MLGPRFLLCHPNACNLEARRTSACVWGCPTPARRTPRTQAWQGSEGRCWTSPKGGNHGACRSGSIDASALWRFEQGPSDAHPGIATRRPAAAAAGDVFAIGERCSRSAAGVVALPAEVVDAGQPRRQPNAGGQPILQSSKIHLCRQSRHSPCLLGACLRCRRAGPASCR